MSSRKRNLVDSSDDDGDSSDGSDFGEVCFCYISMINVDNK